MEPIHMDEKKITAIDNKIRRRIMDHLIDRPYTVTELSHMLSLSVPTVKEHMEKLSNAGIVHVEDSKRKWKYYTLTRDGEMITKSNKKSMPINIVLMFAIVIGGLFILYTLYSFNLGTGTNIGPGIGTNEGAGSSEAPLTGVEDTGSGIKETRIGEHASSGAESGVASGAESGSTGTTAGAEEGYLTDNETDNETLNETINETANEANNTSIPLEPPAAP